MRDQDIARAEKILRDRDNGAYDAQLGIDPETRALLDRATGTEPLSIADVLALGRLERPDLIDAAHRAGRIHLKENQ